MTTALEYAAARKVYSRSHLGRVTRTVGLDGLDLRVEKGEVFGLLGLNGAGKTTAMKLLLGLLFPTAGTVSVLGVKAGTDAAKRAVGYLPELPYFYPYFTAAESVAFYGRLSGMSGAAVRDRVPVVLEQVGLAKHAGKRLSEYSKGMLQRVGVAQAIVHEPEIIVLDEPVSGLDPLAVHDFRELFVSINKAGKTLFLSSHSISDVEKLCSRVAILKSGRLARIVQQAEWQSATGGLEKIFVDTVREDA